MHPRIDEIRQVAALLRKELERWTKRKEDVLPTIDPDDLRGACAIASHTLARCLRAIGVRTQIQYGQVAGGGGHCWLKLSNTDLIVDITATQFDPYTDPILVTRPSEGPKDKGVCVYSNVTWVGSSLIRVLQNESLWGEQTPYEHREDLRKIIRTVVKKFQRSNARNVV